MKYINLIFKIGKGQPIKRLDQLADNKIIHDGFIYVKTWLRVLFLMNLKCVDGPCPCARQK